MKKNVNQKQDKPQSKKQVKKQSKWTVVSIPVETKDLLERIKNRSGEEKALWKIITESLSFYDNLYKKPKSKMDLDMAEKISWYITKLSLSYGMFATNPTEENTAQFTTRLQEIEMRLQIDTGNIQKLLGQYKKLNNEEERKKARIELNQAYKLLIKEMMMKTCDIGQDDNDKGE